MDFSAAITTALTGVAAAATTNLTAIVGPVLGVAVIFAIWRKVKGAVKF